MTTPAIAVVVVSALKVSPEQAAVVAGETVQFTSNATGQAIWEIQEGAAGGTITPDGLYTAPTTPGTYHVLVETSSAQPPPEPIPVPPPGSLPALAVKGNALVDPTGAKVMLRGLSSQGMGMVYGDKSNPGTYLPMSVADYVRRAVQVDATGNKWESRAVRLCFERFPCTDPTRLYTRENFPYAMPDTIAVAPWILNADLLDQELCASGGNRYRVSQRQWRADKGQGWNPGAYVVGDVLAGWQTPSHVYRCSAVPAAVTPNTNWGGGPTHTSGDAPDSFGNTWTYLGEFGTTGTVPPSSLTPVTDNQQQYLIDGLMSWQYESPDYTPAQAEANFLDWVAKVMDPAIQAAVDAGLYAVACDFDFGPADHPLRRARMQAFWSYMAASKWANHPQVLFELWNESCDVGSFKGGPGTWAAQKPAIQETVNVVRAAGATNVIIVPPPFFSAWLGEATADPLTGTNIAYAWHQYRDQYEAFSSNRDQFAQGAASGQCIIVTEWGDGTNPQDPAKTWWDVSAATPLKQLLEPSEGATHPVAGWFAWALTQSWSPDLFLDSALTQPTVFGTATRNALNSKKTDSQPTPGATP